MAKPGWPPALDRVNREKFCAAIMLGCGWETAAAYVGCRPLTVRREANHNPEFEKQWRDAELTAIATPLQTMRKAIAENWKAASWFIERVYSTRYGKQHPRYLSLEFVQRACQEYVQEVSTAIPDQETRRKVIKRMTRLSKLWEQDWRPGHTLKEHERTTPEPQELPPWMCDPPSAGPEPSRGELRETTPSPANPTDGETPAVNST